MDRKITFRNAYKLLQSVVCENLRKEMNDLQEMFSDTEEWILFLMAAPSTSESRNRFPMTPSDVSRTRKRVKVNTIVECVEDDEAMPLPETHPTEPLRRGSRTASKLASTKMKEPRLNQKLRRPGNTIPEEDVASQVHPPKRARKGKSNMPKADMTMVTCESSFASARDSLTSDLCKGEKVDPMENEDDIVFKIVQSTKIATYDDRTKKSSQRLKTVTVMQSSKRITKKLIETVVESPARCMATRMSSIEKNAGSPVYVSDDEDNIRISNFVSKTTQPEKMEPQATKELTKQSKSSAGRCTKKTSSIAVVGQVPILTHQVGSSSKHSKNSLKEISDLQQDAATFTTKVAAKETDVAEKKRGEEAADLQLMNLNDRKTPEKMHLCEAVNAEDNILVNACVVPGKQNNNFKSNPSTNAPNYKTSEAIKNQENIKLDPVSVEIEKSIEDIKQEPFEEPAAPAKPDVPVRMTRTKVRAMMASLSAVNSLPDKKTARKIETSNLLKIANKIPVAKNRGKVEVQKSVEKENTSPPPNGTKSYLSQSILSTNKKNRTGEQEISFVHPSRLLAQMSVSKQPLVNLNANISTFLPKTKVVSAAEKAEEKRKEERRQRRENNDDALLKKKALIEDRTEQQRKKREEKERNVLAQKALKEQEMAEMKMRIEKENMEKARLVLEREEILKKDILRKKEEAKLKAAKIEERRVRQEAERLQALKLQEEQEQKFLAQKKKEQEDAERLQARRMLEEKEKKEKEAAQKEAALKLKKQNQIMNVIPNKPLDATFEVEKPALVAASKYDYPLLDLSKGNDSDFSDAEEEIIPSWAKRESLVKNLKSSSGISIKAMLIYFGSKPTMPDLNKIFTNLRTKHVRSSSAHWKTPPRCSMVPHIC